MKIEQPKKKQSKKKIKVKKLKRKTKFELDNRVPLSHLPFIEYSIDISQLVVPLFSINDNPLIA
jgi:hypothetical protein